MIIRIIRTVFDFDFWLLANDSPLVFGQGLLFGTEARELDELDSCRAYGVGPLEGALGIRDAACYLVEKVGRRDRAVEWGDKVSRESIQRLEREVEVEEETVEKKTRNIPL